jgi:flagellar motility protein MotE (MotC chaperone)
MRLPALYVISAVFGGLLIVRAVAVSAEALAPKTDMSAASEAGSSAVVNGAETDSNSGLDDAAITSSQCLTGDVLDVLQADRAKLSERLTAVTAREKTLATLEVKLKDQMAQIEAANDTLEARIELMETTANEDIDHLVKMYQVMKPKQAAEIFDSMDPAFAAGFLREMNSERAGMIMANMDSRKSYSISIIMAAKNAKYR